MVIRVKGKLPASPKKGAVYEKVVRNSKTGKARLVGFQATGKKGFGKYKIKYNKPYKK